eukprot:scaffold44472_cov26-Tisochrysis_lutea.AAC.6
MANPTNMEYLPANPAHAEHNTLHTCKGSDFLKRLDWRAPSGQRIMTFTVSASLELGSEGKEAALRDSSARVRAPLCVCVCVCVCARATCVLIRRCAHTAIGMRALELYNAMLH